MKDVETKTYVVGESSSHVLRNPLGPAHLHPPALGACAGLRSSRGAIQRRAVRNEPVLGRPGASQRAHAAHCAAGDLACVKWIDRESRVGWF